MILERNRSRRGSGLLILMLMPFLSMNSPADEGLTATQTMPAAGSSESPVPLAELDPYTPQQEVEGDVWFFGSQTLQQVAVIWSDSFRELHPKVNLNIDCRGSETALPSIPDHQRWVGLMSRPLSDQERAELEQKQRNRIAELIICQDVMGIIVHQSNPVPGFADSTESPILVKTASAGVASEWSELNVAGPPGSHPIHILGPRRSSGTRRYLENRLLGSEADGRSVSEYATRDALIEAVAQDPAAISLVSLSHGEPSGVRIVPVAGADGVLTLPTEENIQTRRYPLIRPLYVVVVLNGETMDDPLMRELLSYLLSRSGQEDVAKDGLLPLTHGEAVAQKEKLGWNEAR